jgi:predicted metalloprotease
MRSFAIAAFALVVGIGHLLASPPTPVSAQTRTVESFITTLVVPDVDNFWRLTASQANLAYSPPRVRLMRSGEFLLSSCGSGPASGHSYCGLDRTIDLDVSSASRQSFGTLWQANQDYAIVTIIAHEWAHHVQNVAGLRRSGILLELQADCMAGLFTRWAERAGKLDPGDLNEGVAIALSSGDPTHGTGLQRVGAFRTGYSGAACA